MQVSSIEKSNQGYELIDQLQLTALEEIDCNIADKFELSVHAAFDIIQELAQTVENYVDINAYHLALKEMKLNKNNLALYFQQSQMYAKKHTAHSTKEIKTKALNFCTDDLSLVTDDELKYQLKLEEGFGETGIAYERLLIDSGWAAYPELFKTPLAGKIELISPGCLALVMQDTFSVLIESKQVVRMLYRFVGCHFFEAVAALYQALIPVLRCASDAYAQQQVSTQSDKIGNDYERAVAESSAEEGQVEDKASSTIDVTGLINNWDVPSQFDGDDEGSISEIDLDQLTPDTVIQTLEKNEVAKLLDKLAFKQKLAGHECDSPESIREEIKEALAQLSGDSMLTVIDRVSENIVNLVSHLFENIVNAEHLIPDVSVQIARVQLPVMRFALADTKLFQSSDHPVRQYINRLGELGLKITDSEERGFDKIKESVEELLENFDSNNNIYGDLLNSLEQYIETSNYSTSVVDDCLSTTDFQVENQNRYALSFLKEQHLALRNELVFHKFLRVVWGAVLTRISMGVGVDSNAWDESTQLYSRIIQSTQENSSLEGKRQILRALPTMMSGVRKTFDDYQLNDDVRNSLLDQMMLIHLSIIRGVDGKSIVDDPKFANTTSVNMESMCSASGDTTNTKATDINSTGKRAGNIANNSDLSNSYKHCLEATKDIDFGESTDIDVLVAQWDSEERPDDRAVFRVEDKASPVEFKRESNKCRGAKQNNTVIVAQDEKANLIRETFLQVGLMTLGTLIECEEHGTIVRYQLTHRSTIFGKYTFNDFKRRKSWLLSKPELVMELARGRARIISTPKLFDDTLENVVTQLQAHKLGAVSIS